MTDNQSVADDQSVACAHCGLPSPPPRTPGEPAFCCHGCLGAYQLIHGWGLQDYYALRDRLGGSAVTSVDLPEATGEAAFADLDSPELLGESAPRPVGGGLVAADCSIRGLHCGACAWLIERSVPLIPGWHSARVRMNDHSVELVYDPSRTRLSRIAHGLARLGYRIGPLATDDRAVRANQENRRLLTRIAVAGFCAANAMWIAVALYAGHFSGIAVGHANLFRIVGSLLGAAAVFGPGNLFIRGAVAALRTRTPHMDLPLALALVVGAVAGLFGAVTGRGEVFFDSITMLVFLLLIGRWVQFRQQCRAAQAVQLLMRISPRVAERIGDDGVLRRVAADDLVAGDRIRVDAGQGVAADGIVISGHSAIDRSLLSGESVPVEVGPGDRVEAGTGNLQSPLEIRVETAGRETRVAQLMKRVEDAAANKSPVVQLADRIGGWFVLTVLTLAAITTAIWWTRGPGLAITHAVALLIVACPCALALATPLALAVAIGRAARRRILVRGGEVIERLAKPGTVWFDKTGTLTQGRLRVVDWPGDDDDLQAIARLELGSNHPVARAVVDLAQQRGLITRQNDSPATAESIAKATPESAAPSMPESAQLSGEPTSARIGESVRQQTGGGAQGVIDGRTVAVGKASFIRSLIGESADRDGRSAAAERLESRLRQLAGSGISPIVYTIGSAPPAVFGVADTVRTDARDCISALRAAGWRVGMLSGDHPECVDRVASELGIESNMAFGDLPPEAKWDRIRSPADGTVVMVGDGINDAAALAAADVGVAVRGGAEASLEAAPVFLASGTLAELPELMVASRQTVRLIKRTFAVSLSYNSLAIMLAMAGKIGPLTAALIMPASSLTVLAMIIATATFPGAKE